MPEPELRTQVQPDGLVRVELDADLALEVRQVRNGMEVTVDGTPTALQPLEGVEQEIGSALKDAGSHLERFAQQHRPPQKNTRRGDGDGNVSGSDGPGTPPLVGHSLIHVVA